MYRSCLKLQVSLKTAKSQTVENSQLPLNATCSELTDRYKWTKIHAPGVLKVAWNRVFLCCVNIWCNVQFEVCLVRLPLNGSIVSVADRCSVRLSVILASVLTSATHTHSNTHSRGWSQWQSSLQDNRWTKGTQRGEFEARTVLSGVGVKVDSWRGLMGDEMVVGGCDQVDLGLCVVVRWGAKATGFEGGDRGWRAGKDKGCDASRSLQPCSD